MSDIHLLSKYISNSSIITETFFYNADFYQNQLVIITLIPYKETEAI